MKTTGILALCVFAILPNLAWAATEEQRAEFKTVLAEFTQLSGSGQFKEALPLAQQALSLGKTLYPPTSKSLPALEHNVGRTLLKLRRHSDALPVLTSAREAYSRVYEKDAPEFIDLYLDLAEAARGDDYESSWSRYDDDALGIARKFYGEESADYALMLIDVGHVEFINQGEHGERRITDGFEILQPIGAQHPRWAYANFVRAKVEMSHRRYTQALSYLNTSVDLLSKADSNPTTQSTLMTALAFQSVALEETGQGEQATASLLQIGRIKESLGDTSAEPVFTVKPTFPSSVRTATTGTLLNVEKMNEGTASIVFDIDERGFTTNHRVDFVIGPQAYADATIEAVKKFRYAPRFQNGQPVPITGARYQIRFLLNL